MSRRLRTLFGTWHETQKQLAWLVPTHQKIMLKEKGERLDNDPSGARYGCFLPDLTGLARRLPAPTSQDGIYVVMSYDASVEVCILT
ncbi:hypothetical protein NBRC116594_28900 [Shimia sp. NS0008-38b]